MPYEAFFLRILSEYKANTDILVLDELLYISRARYRVPYEITLSFIESVILPYVGILPLAEGEYRMAARMIEEFGIKPSDALHASAMMVNNIFKIATEDRDFEKIRKMERIWL